MNIAAQSNAGKVKIKEKYFTVNFGSLRLGGKKIFTVEAHRTQ